MKKRLTAILLAACACTLLFGARANADEPAAWGIPLGVSDGQLRAKMGTPDNVSTRAPLARLPFGAAQQTYTIYTYHRSGITFTVSMAKDRVASVSMVGGNSQVLGASDAEILADPLGVPTNGTMTDILIKSGAVKAIDPESGVAVITALMTVTHGRLRLTYNIISGKIYTESIYLLPIIGPGADDRSDKGVS